MLDVEIVQRTHPGRVRPGNEDFVDYAAPTGVAEVRSHGWLLALADGVGGHERGEVASRIAVEGVIAGFRSSSGPEPHTALLTRLVQSANTDVYEAGRTSSAAAPMATTIVACALRFASAVVAHVGDSRCYLLRRAELTQLTRDHTFAGRQMRLGMINAQDAATSSARHMLTRSLGSDMFVSVDTQLVELHPDDVLLLCSDGLHSEVGDDDMARVLQRHPDLAGAGDALIELANERGGHDNISLQLARVRSVERMGMYRGRPYKIY